MSTRLLPFAESGELEAALRKAAADPRNHPKVRAWLRRLLAGDAAERAEAEAARKAAGGAASTKGRRRGQKRKRV